MQFEVTHTDAKSGARLGRIGTDHGEIITPIFMPVGTAGTVKAVHQQELKELVRAEIILGNTYHLYLRPGLEVIQAAGGLHRFMTWDRPVLTDSGGYQVYSLGSSRKITEQGVIFKSHIDGSTHDFTPEYVMDIQRIIGADIMMAFDECTPYPCERKYAEDSMHMTHRWLARCLTRFGETDGLYGHSQALFPIVQGSTFPDLRRQSAEFVANVDAEGNAIGGLSVGEPHEEMYAMTGLVCQVLPKDRPGYLMGVGTPANILECIALGVDMFDCVMPTRNARNGMLFTSEGIINIRNEKWKNDFSLLDPIICKRTGHEYSKAYLRHLITAKEMLGAQIASIQNLSFYKWLVEQAREHIKNSTFAVWKNEMVEKVSRRL